MIWTDDLPIENGWYWYRSSEKGFQGIVECRDGSFRAFGEYLFIDETIGQWAGPILLPVEKEVAAKQELELLME